MSDMFLKTEKSSEPQHETPNKPFTPTWSTYIRAYHTPRSTPTTSLTSAGSFSYPSWWSSQARGSPLQYAGSLHDPMRLSNYPMVSGGTAAMAFSEKVTRMNGGKNLDSTKKSDENLPHKSLATSESEENKKGSSSISKTNTEELSLSAASESMGSPYKGRGANNANESTKTLFKDFPSTKKQQCNMMLGNGQDAQKETSLKNCNDVHENLEKDLNASATKPGTVHESMFAANPTKLNQNLGTGLNASDTNPQLEKLESEIRKEKKRQSNKRSRMKKEKQCEELGKSVDNLKVENSELKKKLLRLSEETEELTNENNSILKELAEKYGADSVESLTNTMPAAPPDQSVAGGSGSNS